MTQKKTYLSWLLGLICAFSLMIMFLITSVEAVAYWTPHYYENEYTRYQVADDVHMEMDDLLYVTDEMMAYLRGSRDDLNIDTVVDGTPREFFNAREKAHMADVRNLFLGGLALRRLCLFLAAASVALLALLKAEKGRPHIVVGGLDKARHDDEQADDLRQPRDEGDCRFQKALQQVGDVFVQVIQGRHALAAAQASRLLI